MDFSQFDLHPDLLDGIDALNFTTPTPIQQQAIPLILQGRDLIGTAQTGTGKTAAFILPVLNKIMDSGESGFTQALVLVPTRELAVQIGKVVDAYSYFTGISSIAIYGGGGGNDFSQEKTAITSGADILIATPGRLIAHINLGYVKFGRLETLILDEADRMLDMGFMPDIQKIIAALPKNRQNLLFSATMPQGVLKLTKTILNDPAMVKIALSKPAEGVEQGAYFVSDENQKLVLVTDLLKNRVGERILVFCSSKLSVNNLFRNLRSKNVPAERISSDLEQTEREQVMLDFRSRKIDILVATDVLSRGIDVEGIDLVLNFDVPHDAEDYVHRVGRTARAQRRGEAITLVVPKELRRFKQIEKLIGREVPKRPLPEGLAATQSRSGEPRESRQRREKNGRDDRRRDERRPQKPTPQPAAAEQSSAQNVSENTNKKRRRKRGGKGRGGARNQDVPAV